MRFINSNLINIGASMSVFVVNYILKVILKGLGRFERYKSVTLQTESIMVKLFVAVYVNMGILIILINANLQRYGFVESI